MLRERINKGNIYTCQKHYKVEDFEFTPTGRKKVKLYVMPSLNLLTKSHETKTFPERLVRPREPLPVKAKNTNCFGNLEDLNKRLTKLKIEPWSYRICNDKTYTEVNEALFLVPKYSIKIDESLNFIATVYNWPYLKIIMYTLTIDDH